MLEKLAIKLVPETETQDIGTELDERLLVTPPIALEKAVTRLVFPVPDGPDNIVSSLDCIASKNLLIISSLYTNFSLFLMYSFKYLMHYRIGLFFNL